MNSFCRFLSNSISVLKTNKGYNIIPCCTYRTEHIIPDLSPENIKKARAQFKDIPDWTPGCEECKIQEGGRINNADQFQSPKVKSLRDASFSLLKGNDDSIQNIEIMMHNVCESACMTCSSYSSSGWHKELKKLNILAEHDPYMFDQNELAKLLSNDLSNVKRAKFWGGEPFINELHTQFMEAIPNKKDCSLIYAVSGARLPSSKALDLFKEFKQVQVLLSCDGIEKQFEYLRWPIKWDQFVSNILELRETMPSTVYFDFYCTLNPLNVFYVDNIEKWIREHFNENKFGVVSKLWLGSAVWTDLGIDNTPKELVNTILSGDSTVDEQEKRILSGVTGFNYQVAVDYCDRWDKVRNLNWREVFPEIVEYFV